MRAAPRRRKPFQGKELELLGFAVVVILITTHKILPLGVLIRLTVVFVVELRPAVVVAFVVERKPALSDLVKQNFLFHAVVMLFHFVSPKKVMSARASLIQTLHINAHGISLAGRAISSIRFRASSRSAKWYL